MISFIADCKAGVCPNIMARFREEWYASRTYKALARGARSPKGTPPADWRPRGSQYVQKSLSVRKAYRKASQARLDGFD